MSGAKLKSLEDLVTTSRIIVCCGTGGVGKTTTSAALALCAARLGRRAIVITIDPAKRLATSLGLKTLSDDPTDLTANVKKVAARKHEKVSGEFWAVVPDSERTFERFVRSVGNGNDHLVSRVLRTSIYKIFTQEFAGAHEYMAMEKLYELSQKLDRGEADLIVLDTPPSANTRLFLDAPLLMAAFFDESLVKWLLAPGGKLVAAGVNKMVDVLERLTGRGFISELIEFTRSLFELRSQFQDNLKKVSRLLHGQGVSFLMVTTPERLHKRDTQAFVEKLDREKYPFWGFVINRVLHKRLGIDDPSVLPRISKEIGAQETQTSQALIENFEKLMPQLRHESETIDFLQKFARVFEVAEQSTDVHSIDALYELSKSYC